MQKFLIRLMVVLYFVTFAVGFVYLSFDERDILPTEVCASYYRGSYRFYRDGMKYFADFENEHHEISRKQYKMAVDVIRGEGEEIPYEEHGEMKEARYMEAVFDYPFFGKKKCYRMYNTFYNETLPRKILHDGSYWMQFMEPEAMYDIYDEYDADYLCLKYETLIGGCEGFSMSKASWGYGTRDTILSDSKFSGIESMLPKNETQVWTPILREFKLSEWDNFLDNSVIVRNPDPIARRMMVFEIRKAILTKGKLPVLEGIGKVCHVFFLFSIETPIFAAGMMLVTRKRSAPMKDR